jgi:hypothetical protein
MMSSPGLYPMGKTTSPCMSTGRAIALRGLSWSPSRTPAQLSTKAISPKIQWFILVYHSGTQWYIVLHDPFVHSTTPCLNHPCSNQTVRVIDDVRSIDASLGMVHQPANLFNAVSATYVPFNIDYATAPSALQGPMTAK